MADRIDTTIAEGVFITGKPFRTPAPFLSPEFLWPAPERKKRKGGLPVKETLHYVQPSRQRFEGMGVGFETGSFMAVASGA